MTPEDYMAEVLYYDCRVIDRLAEEICVVARRNAVDINGLKHAPRPNLSVAIPMVIELLSKLTGHPVEELPI